MANTETASRVLPTSPMLRRLAWRGFVLLLAGGSTLLLALNTPGSEFYVGPLLFFFLSLAACAILIEVRPIGRRVASVMNGFAAFLDRQGAFRSNPEVEVRKFALLRVLFGVFLVQRAVWILVYMTPSDWDNPTLAFHAAANLVVGALVLFGFLTQWALAYLILVQWQISDGLLGTGTLGNDVGAMLAFLLMCANAGTHLSVDAALRRGPFGGWLFYYDHGLPGRNVLQLAKFFSLLCYWCVCVYSLMMHLNEPAWMTGTAGPLLLTNNFMSRYSSEFVQFFQLGPTAVMAGKVALWAMLPWYALVLPFVLLGGVFRTYVIAWGVLFFALSLFVLQLGWLAEFEFIFFAGLFWQKAFIDRPGSLHVAYDDRCNLCDRTVKFVSWVDLFRRVELRPLSQNHDWLRRHGIDPAAAFADLYGLEFDRGGRVAHGYEFYVLLSRRILLLLPVYPVLILGRWTGIGPALYRYIADRRTRLFGVCQVPSVKARQRVLPDGAVVAERAGRTDPIVSFGFHIALLACAYLLTTPAPFAGWNGVPFPAALQRFVPDATGAAHIYGMTPINVFNDADLRMAENWFTLSIVGSDGGRRILPVLAEDGKRLAVHRSDRMYFGHTLAFRRSAIDQEGCLLEKYRPYIAYIADYYLPGLKNGEHLDYDQYHRPVPNQAKLLGGIYEEAGIVKVCSISLPGSQQPGT